MNASSTAIRAVLVMAIFSIIAPALLSAYVLVITPRAEAAQASACYAIGDPDARATCLAKARKDPGMCYAVVDTERRAACLSEVRK
jgi:hypothetical protein